MACKTKKRRYPTKFDADIDLSRIIERSKRNRKHGKKKIPTRSYGPCPLCGGYHLTSQAKGEQE